MLSRTCRLVPPCLLHHCGTHGDSPGSTPSRICTRNPGNCCVLPATNTPLLSPHPGTLPNQSCLHCPWLDRGFLNAVQEWQALMADPFQMQHPDFKAQLSAGQQPPGIWNCEIHHLHMGTQQHSTERGRHPGTNCLTFLGQL